MFVFVSLFLVGEQAQFRNPVWAAENKVISDIGCQCVSFFIASKVTNEVHLLSAIMFRALATLPEMWVIFALDIRSGSDLNSQPR